MKNDAKNFDGKPFNGKTVAEYFGNQGAAIVALANIVKSILADPIKRIAIHNCNDNIVGETLLSRTGEEAITADITEAPDDVRTQIEDNQIPLPFEFSKLIDENFDSLT